MAGLINRLKCLLTFTAKFILQFNWLKILFRKFSVYLGSVDSYNKIDTVQLGMKRNVYISTGKTLKNQTTAISPFHGLTDSKIVFTVLSVSATLSLSASRCKETETYEIFKSQNILSHLQQLRIAFRSFGTS